MNARVIECSNCGMHQLFSQSRCGFCESRLFLDKVRHCLTCNIPYLSLCMVILFTAEILVHMSSMQVSIIHLFDQIVFAAFVTDLALDRHLHKLDVSKFMRRRMIDMAFLIPLIKCFKVFEHVPRIAKAAQAAHLFKHVPIPDFGGVNLYKAVKTAKYAKYAYPVVRSA